jgi:hypothetical protein
MTLGPEPAIAQQNPVTAINIALEPDQMMVLRLQQELIDAVTLCTVKAATAAAFYTTPEEPDINPSVIDYIATSMPILAASISARMSP